MSEKKDLLVSHEVGIEVIETVKRPSQEVIRQQFNIQLATAKYKELVKSLHSISFTKENVGEIKQAISNLKAVKKVIEEKHKSGKSDAWQECQAWDAAKREADFLIDKELTEPERKYKNLCKQIEEEARLAKLEEERKSRIINGIEANVASISEMITNANSAGELVAVEKLIGSLKSQKAKYMEFHGDLISKLEGLTPIIKEQKKLIKSLEKQKSGMAMNPSAESIEGQQEVADALQVGIEENKVKAQEVALNSLIDAPISSPTTPTPTTVKPRRSTWKTEVVDIQKLAKEKPELVTLVANEVKIKEVLGELKSSGALDGKEEVVQSGIRFYLHKEY